MEAEFLHGGGFCGEAFEGGVFGGGVDDLDVVAFVFGHHLVAGDAGEDGVHDGPLAGGEIPAVLGFGLGELDGLADAGVEFKAAGFDEDAAPDDPSGLADAFHGASAEAEVHGRLAFGGDAGPAVDEVGGRDGAGDFEDPDVVVDGAFAVGVFSFAGVVAAPAEVVEGVVGRVAELFPELVGDEAVESGAFIDFVEMGEGLAFVEFAAVFGEGGRAIGAVEGAFDEVGCGGEVFEALLVLDADGGAAEFVGDADARRCTFCIGGGFGVR